MKKFSAITFFLLSLTLTGYAKEVTIIYTGDTHAMLYPCNCPKESDGGIARRATLIKELRRKNPQALLLDSGGYFAGGLMDEYTQNTQLDMERSRVNLEAMELMRYDALGIGDDEFNFGENFFLENIASTKLVFLSCNLLSEAKNNLIQPYLIKEAGGLKIGIVGLTPVFAQPKINRLKVLAPLTALKQTVAELEKEKVGLIILLSHLGEPEDLKLIKEIPQIQVVISGHARLKSEPFNRVGSSLILRPSWQGRRLGKLALFLDKENKIMDLRIEEIRLSDEVRDDPKILSLLPACFSDADCKRKDFSGRCENAGTSLARCLTEKRNKIPLLVIMPKHCVTCDPAKAMDYLKTHFADIGASYLYYPQKIAKALIEELRLNVLPAYLLEKEAEKEKNFERIKENLEERGKYYLLKPQFSGWSYFLKREKIRKKLDFFLSLYDPDASGLLEAVREFHPAVHFLAVEQKEGFDAKGGKPEIEEYLRSVCVEKYYPQIFWSYLSCRAKNIQSSWWEDCLSDAAGAEKIKDCSRGEEGKKLLRENITLNKELEIMFGPTYLVENQEIFSTQGPLRKEGLRRIIKRIREK